MNADPGRWLRRAASLSLYTTLGVLTLGLLPGWLLLAGAVDLALDRRFPRVRAVAFFAIYLGCELLGVLAAAWIWARHGRGPPGEWRAANAALQRAWTAALMGGACWAFSMKVRVEGAGDIGPGPFLLFVRHSSTADTVLAAALVANPRCMLLRYVLKSDLLWDPCLDIVGQRLPNTFVRRGSGAKEREIAAVVALVDGVGPDDGVLIYPEGTRFSPVKLERARAKLADRPELAALAATYRHVLPPRLGGPLALLETGLDVVFLDHCGFEGSSSFGAFWNGGLVGTTLAVRLRRVAASVIPVVGRDVWLFEQWQQTDAWVEANS